MKTKAVKAVQVKETSAEEMLAKIIPGKNYPPSITITEKIGGKLSIVRIHMNSYFVGMYCAIYVDGASMPIQTGDHNNKILMAKVKKDVARAIARGAKVEISALVNVKTMIDVKAKPVFDKVADSMIVSA